MHSSVVEVDERLGNVPIQHQTDDVDDKKKRERVEQSARLEENRQSCKQKQSQLNKLRFKMDKKLDSTDNCSRES